MKEKILVALSIGCAVALATGVERAIDKFIDEKTKKDQPPKPEGYDQAVNEVVEAAKKLGAFTAPKAEETKVIPQFTTNDTTATIVAE